jgi:hypothetical protein
MLCDRVDPADGPVFIGETLFRNERVARIKPLAEARDGRWHLLGDTTGRFPDEGTVVSFDPRVVGRDEGYLVLFTIGPNERFQPGSKKDKWMTAEVSEPYEIFRQFAVLPEDRRLARLTTDGFSKGLQVNDRVIVELPGNRCAFPKVQPLGWTAGWGVAHDQDLACIPLYEEPEGIGGLTKIKGRYFALPGIVPTKIVGAVNWQPDTDFLDTLIKFLKRTADLQPGADIAGLSQKMRQRLYAVYRDAGVIMEDPAENEALLERLGGFLARLDTQVDIVEQVAREVYEHPHVRAELARLSEDETRRLREVVESELRRELRVEIDREMEASREALGTIQDEVAKLDLTRASLWTELEQLSALKDTELRSVTERLDRLTTSAGSFAGDVNTILEVARAFGIGLPPAGKVPADVMPEAPWARSSTAAVEPFALAELPDIATATAKRAGLPAADLMRLDVLARAGEVPLVVGPAAERLISTYAGLVAGGDLRRMPLDPTVLSPDDLWVHPARRERTALATAWQEAEREPDVLRIVCLDDLDAASLTGWFPRFRRLFHDVGPENLVLVATVTQRIPFEEDTTVSKGYETTVKATYAPGGALAAVNAFGRERVRRRLRTPHRHRLGAPELERIGELVSENPVRCASDVPRLVRLCAAAAAWQDVDDAFAFASGLIVAEDEDVEPNASEIRRNAERSLRPIT